MSATTTTSLSQDLRWFWIWAAARKASIGLPGMLLFLTDRGVSSNGIGMAVATLAAMLILFEVPSGIMSDRLGRRLTLVVGGLLRAVAWFLVGVTTTEWDAIFAFGCIGASFAFDSGTDSAWLYDTTLKHNATEQYPQLEARGVQLGFVSLGIACLLGTFILTFNPQLAMFFTVIPMLLSAFAATQLSEPNQERPSLDRFFISAVGQGLKEVSDDKQLLQLTLLSVLVIAGCEVYFRFVQQFLVYAAGISPTPLGVLYAVWLGITALGAGYAPKLMKLRSVVVGRYCAVTLGLLFIMLAASQGLASVFLTLFPQFLFGLLPVIFRREVNAVIQSSVRATVLSAFGFLISAAMIVGGLLAGWIANKAGIPTAITALGTLIILLSIVVHLFGSAYRSTQRKSFWQSLWS